MKIKIFNREICACALLDTNSACAKSSAEMEKSMRKMKQKAADSMKAAVKRAAALMRDTRGENYVDTAVKILIAVVLGALLLAGLYTLFGDVVMPTLTQRIQEMFNYAG